MKITPPLAHSFAVVTEEICKIYSHNYGVKQSEVSIILQGDVVHILLKGKALEKLNTKHLHTLEYKKLMCINGQQKEKES